MKLFLHHFIAYLTLLHLHLLQNYLRKCWNSAERTLQHLQYNRIQHVIIEHRLRTAPVNPLPGECRNIYTEERCRKPKIDVNRNNLPDEMADEMCLISPN